VAVDRVDGAERGARSREVVVQRADPTQERVEVARRGGRGDAMDLDAGPHLAGRVGRAPARQHVDVLAVRGERPGELSDVAGEPALDDGRVLPGEQKDAAHEPREPSARGRRGGLFFQSRLDVRAARGIEHPRIVLDRGWVEGMQVNSIEPAPVSEATRDGRVVLSYDALEAGDLLQVWFQFEVNPTNVGRRPYAVELDDAERPLARLSPDITVWP
jgi:hypothetical protein